MSGEQKHTLMKRIKANHYDFILFSGGGNDIVGRYDFDFFVEEKRPGMQAIDCINRSRLDRKLGQIAAAYEELIERASQYSVNPAMKIVTHTSRLQAQRNEVLSTLRRAFNGALTPMVQCLIDSGKLSAAQLAELERLIQARRKERK